MMMRIDGYVGRFDCYPGYGRRQELHGCALRGRLSLNSRKIDGLIHQKGNQVSQLLQ